jgi:hypothetical protein
VTFPKKDDFGSFRLFIPIGQKDTKTLFEGVNDKKCKKNCLIIQQIA